MTWRGTERFRWARPAWREEADEWIRTRLAGLGYSNTGQFDQSWLRPWGTVIRVPTSEQTLWFKASIAGLAFEIPLLELLAERRPDTVPRVLAADADRAWMLLEDAGVLLEELYGDVPPLHVWEEFLDLYARLQLDVAAAADELVDVGVPDRRPGKLLEALGVVLDTDELVRPPSDAALTEDELERLKTALPGLAAAERRLVALDLPASIQHDDLHPWNVCVNKGRYRFIDWGDSCVAHPLLSLTIPIADVGADHAAAARDAYLRPWTTLRSHEDLVAATDGAILLGHATGVLKWVLIMSGLDQEEQHAAQDVIPKRLRWLLESACA